MPPAPGAPLITRPLPLRLINEELSTPANGELEEDGVIVGGSIMLEVLLKLIGVLGGGTALLGGSAVLILTVLL